MKMASRGPAQSGGRARGYYSFNLPVAISDRIHPDTEFEVELTDEGILFRVVSAPPQVDDEPQWIREGRILKEG